MGASSGEASEGACHTTEDKQQRELDAMNRLEQTKAKKKRIDGIMLVLTRMQLSTAIDSSSISLYSLSLSAAMEQKMRVVASLDLAIMLDCTGSMYVYLENAKTQIYDFVDSIGRIYPDIPLSIAFIGYRDHWDGPNRLVVQPFTRDIELFRSKVSTQHASGGNTLTDTIGALSIASTLDWSAHTRILYHIGDMPCRGREYHNESHDPYAGGDPYGLNPATLMTTLCSKEVQYYFGKITEHTNKMIDKFNEHLGWTYVKTTPMNACTMMKVLTTSVTASLTASLSSSTTDNERNEEKSLKSAKATLSDVTPNWSIVPEEEADEYSLRRPRSLDSLIKGNDSDTAEFCNELRIQCALQPFALGSAKVAYYGHTGGRMVVIKESIALCQAQESKEKCESCLSTHRVAMHLASEFNQIKPLNCPAVVYSDIKLLHYKANQHRSYVTMEDKLLGRWERFNNNSGFCAPFPTDDGTDHEVVQAFSHWTYDITHGHMIVVDCQGSFDAQQQVFQLTDPAVHCIDILRFGSTNMGVNGFKRFFKTHRCNRYCRELSLAEQLLSRTDP